MTHNTTNREETEKKILEFVSAYTKRIGCGPTYREIGQAIGLSSTSSVSRHIHRMMNSGLLETDKHRRLRLSMTRLSDRPEQNENEKRLKLKLADGGEVRLDCYLERDRLTGKAEVRLGGILEVDGGRVTRIIGCSEEPEERRAAGGGRG